MNHDERTGGRNVGLFERFANGRELLGRIVYGLCGLFCVCSVGHLDALEVIHNAVQSYAGAQQMHIGRHLNFVNTSGGSNSVTINYRLNGGTWRSLTIGPAGMVDPFVTDFHAPIFWSGLTSSGAGSTRSITSSSKSVTLDVYIVSSANMKTHTTSIDAQTGNVLYGSPVYKYWLPDAMTVQVGLGDNSIIITDLSVPEKKELFLALLNKGAIPILINWGSKLLELKPGLNLIRYDGPTNAGTGLPSVSPTDFKGTVLTNGGKQYVVGEIAPNSTGGGTWQPAPVIAPTAPSGGNSQVAIRNDYGSGSITLTNQAGVTTVAPFPPTVPPAPPRSTGTGATLSDPTLPNPGPTTNNTTTTVVNNTTNTTNVITTNTTIEGTPSDDDGGAAAAAAFNATGEVLPTAPGEPGVAGSELKDFVQSKPGEISSAFGGFKNILAIQTIPQTMSYPLNISLGSMGSINTQIDFNAMPFPPVRAALLVMCTLGVAVAFMKNITI
jgi:hypothetical protein